MEFFKPRSNEINSAVAQHLQKHSLLNNALKTSWMLLLKAIHKPTVTSIILTIERIYILQTKYITLFTSFRKMFDFTYKKATIISQLCFLKLLKL